MSSDLPDIPVPASQLVTLETKLNKAKAQLKPKTTEADKLKVRQLKRKFFLAKGMSGNSRKRNAPAERDNFQPAAIESQTTYLNDSYLLVCVLQKKISRS